MQLIIARPSPFARKARIALLEKGIPFETIMDVPWNADTVAPAHNPLGKIPVLLLDDGTSVYDSRVIIDYLETLGRPPQLIPEDAVARLRHRQIEALADGVCDAVVLIVLENQRQPERRSADWIARQRRKIEAGTAEMARQLGEPEWPAGEEIGLADIAAGCMAAYLDLRLPEFPWRERHPNLAAFSDRLERRPSFQATRPEPQVITPLG